LESEIVRSIFQDRDGNYWFGSANGGLAMFDGTNLVNVLKEGESKLGFIRKMVQLGKGIILFATTNGLYEYDGKKFVKANEKFGLPSDSKIGDLIPDGDGFLISVFGLGVAKYDEKGTKIINVENSGIATNNVNNLVKDSKGNIWMGSNIDGLTMYQPDPLRYKDDPRIGARVEKFSSSNGLNNNYVIQVAEDSFGRIWVATFGGGLNIYNGKGFTVLDSEKGLSSDLIYSVLVDDEGNIWAGTQNGVDKVVLNEVGDVEEIINYDKYDGFTGVETNGMSNYKDSEGNLWFGTIKGVMRYKPDVNEPNTIPPVTRITGVRLFFKEIPWGQDEYDGYREGVTAWGHLPINLSLPHNKNHLTFDFEALSFKVPERVKYQWKLEGLDTDWSVVSSKTEAVYSNIPPGRYTFLVKACNDSGIWNQEPISYSFEILAPWYDTLMFRSILFLLMIGIVFSVYKWRVNSIRKQKDELERLVHIKTAEVVKQKDEIMNQARELKRSHDNMKLLGEIGKDITSNLEIQKIIYTVYENVNAIMDANVFWVGIYNEENQRLEFKGAIEEGNKLPSFSFDLQDEDRLAVWCFKHKKEVFINDYFKEYTKYIKLHKDVIVGNLTNSIIYLPLVSKEKTIGVISVQSYELGAYSDYHLNLLRNIAIHTKIALENAEAYGKITRQSKNLQKQKDEIERKNKELTELNEEKNHLIGIVAHDLRNPLTSALTIGNILKQDVDELNEDQRECAEQIVKSLNRMNDMIQRILNVKAIESRNISLHLEKTNLYEIILNIKNTFKESILKKGIDLKLENNDAMPVAMVDRNYVTQVYENLVSNAIKFSPPNHSVLISLKGENGTIRTEIKDQGPGLTDEDMQKVFKKYQRLSARPTAGEPSIGLGLSIVKKYVDAMNGKVWCESEYGKGANFIVSFERIKE